MNAQDTNSTHAHAAQELDAASLDLVVGGGVIIHEATGGELDARKQEQSEKFAREEKAKQRG